MNMKTVNEKGRMYLYVWSDQRLPEKSKFGDHFVEDAHDADVEVRDYIRFSLGREKYKWDHGNVTVHLIIDVSEYAAMVGRNRKHGKMDDYVRRHIGFRTQSTGDFHNLPGDELVGKILDHLKKVGQKLPTAGLAIWQHDTLIDTMADIKVGNRTIVLEACARFGKTIFTGALVRETNAPLTIVASYVLTSFRSFMNDLSSFEQFRNMALVDTASADYQAKIKDALAQGQQVIAFMSMCGMYHNRSRIAFLFGLKTQRTLVIDEADFGAWRPGQTIPLLGSRAKNDVVILMTGTNGDKASALWPDVTYHSITYPELLLIKADKTIQYTSKLQHFAIDAKRHQMVASVEFYQADLSAVVKLALKAEPDLFTVNTDTLPSYSKAAKDANKAAGFWSRLFEATLCGKHGIDELNMRTQLRLDSGRRVVMWFAPGSMTNEQFANLAAIARDSLASGWDVTDISGDTTSNRHAEQRVMEAVEISAKAKRSLLILSKGMAQRSFSIPEITEVYLAYDTGDTGATIQRLSRALTPAVNKTARVISLSFNPNRDDKFDAVLIQTAKNYATKHAITLPQALRVVLSTVDLWRCANDGAIRLQSDSYTKQLIENDRLGRLVGSKADMTSLTADQIAAIAGGNAEAFKTASAERAKSGKTHDQPAGRSAPHEMAKRSMMVKAREVIATIVDNMHLMIAATGAKTIDDMLRTMDGNIGFQQRVTEIFGVDYALIVLMIEQGVMNRDLIELTLTA